MANKFTNVIKGRTAAQAHRRRLIAQGFKTRMSKVFGGGFVVTYARKRAKLPRRRLK